jgi:tetratricopeptide (TPR) repeat protein
MKKMAAGMLVFVVILVALELLLGLFDLGRHDREFMPKSAFPIFVPGKGEQKDFYVTSSHFARFINDQQFQKKKPSGVTRIFVVGGSAAYGWPYTEEYAFSGYLRRALARVAPGKFEIVNASGMSYGSHRVRDVLRDVVLFAPDLVIVFSGNNEFVERNVLPEINKPPGAATALAGVLGRLDLYRAVRLLIYRVAPGLLQQHLSTDITDIRENPDVERGSLGRSTTIDAAVLKNYRQNLFAIRDFLRANHIPALLCTVPTNVSGWLPATSPPRFASQKALQQYLELLEQREKAFNQREIKRELAIMEQILALTPDDAGMVFNYGKTLWNAGRREDSYQEMVRAKDLDTRPWRALSTQNKVLRRMDDPAGGVYLVDLEDIFRSRYLQGQSASLFLDYCHFSSTGNKLVALALLPVIRKAAGAQFPMESVAAAIEQDDHPKAMDNYVLGHELYARAITLQNNHLYGEAIATYLQVLDKLGNFSAALTNLAYIYYQQGKYDDAASMYSRAIEANPGNIDALLGMGFLAMADRQWEQAAEYLNRAVKANPYAPDAYAALGDIAMHKSLPGEAIGDYNRAISLGRDDRDIRRSLGWAHLKNGDTSKALANWQAALQFNPADQEIRALIGRYGTEK